MSLLRWSMSRAASLNRLSALSHPSSSMHCRWYRHQSLAQSLSQVDVLLHQRLKVPDASSVPSALGQSLASVQSRDLSGNLSPFVPSSNLLVRSFSPLPLRPEYRCFRAFATDASDSKLSEAKATPTSSSSEASEKTAKKNSESTSSEVVQASRLTRAWEFVKHEALHLWTGSKLLAANVKTAARLLRKLTKGKSLSRRERRLLTITAADVARLVPFLFFVLIPFMEFLLPVALKLFPDMLPSTFRDKHRKEERMKQQLQMRLELAEFLQETTEVMAHDIKSRSSGESNTQVNQLITLLDRVREGRHVTNNDLLNVAVLFKDELTLDRLSRQQLLSMSRYMGLPAYGSDAKLISELERSLDDIREDDQVIRDEGIETLDIGELRAACAHRGIRVMGVGVDMLRRRLADWLSLSLDHSIPPSLMVLSRVFTFNRIDDSANIKAIKTTLARLGEDVVDDVIMESTGHSDYSQKLDNVRRQLELCDEEEALALKKHHQELVDKLEDMRLKAEEATATKPEELLKDSTEEIVAPSSEELPSGEPSTPKITKSDVHDVLKDKIQIEDVERAEELKSKLKEISEDLAVLADDSALTLEREQLEELKGKWSSLDEHERQVAEAVVAKAVSEPAARRGAAMLDKARPLTCARSEKDVEKPPTEVTDDAAAAAANEQAEAPSEEEKEDPEEGLRERLQKKVGAMLSQLQSDIDRTDSKIGNKLRLLDRDNDGIMSYDEVKDALRHSLKDVLTDAEARAIIENLDIKKDGIIDTEELRTLIRQRTSEDDSHPSSH